MGATQITPTPFGRKLRAEIDKRGWGVRTLAREMAARDNAPQRTESIRRQLKRYLSEVDPVRPTVTSRRFIEDTLGLERDALDDADDAEAAQVAPAAAGLQMLKDLVARLEWDGTTERRRV